MPDYDSPAKQPEPRNYVPALTAILKMRTDLEGGENTAAIIAQSIAGDARFLPESELRAYADHAVATRPHLAALVKPPTLTPMEAAVAAHRANMNVLGVGLDRAPAVAILPPVPAGPPVVAQHDGKSDAQLAFDLVGHMQSREGAFRSSLINRGR